MTLLSDSSTILGKWLLARRQRLPLWLFLLSILALLIARPFWITPDSLWLNIPCLLVAFGGMVIRMVTVGYTPPGAHFQTRGMYAVCRHPLELGSFLIWLSIFAYTGVLGWMLFGLVLRSWLIEKFSPPRKTLYAVNSERIITTTPVLHPPFFPYGKPGKHRKNDSRGAGPYVCLTETYWD